MNNIKNALQILEAHDIKLEFENPENFVKALEELTEQLLNDKLSEIFHSTSGGLLYEFDLTNKKIISTGLFYPLSTKDYTPHTIVNFHLEILSKIFSFYPRNLFNLFDDYGIMYKGQDLNYPVQYYYTVEKEIFLDVEKEDWENLCDFLNIAKHNKDFLCEETDNLYLRYAGFNLDNKISKLGFHTLLEYFYARNPKKHYSSYTKFESVCDIISEIALEEMVSLQYSPQDNDYFGLEISIPMNKIKEAAKKLYDASIISKIQYENMYEMNITEEYENSVLKFRWETPTEFDIKFYLQKYSMK